MIFKKSRFSQGNSNCVEVGAPAFKSSFSGKHGGCVEVEMPLEDLIIVRDTKEAGNPNRQALRFTRTEWRAFLAGAKAGEFDLADENVSVPL